LTTGGSFDDTMDDTCAWNFSALTVMAFVLFFSLVLWILALRFDIPFSYPPHLQYSILHRAAPSLRIHPICTPQSHSHDTYTHIIQHTPRMRRYSLHSYFFPPYYCITVSSSSSRSVLHSLFSVRSDRFALIIAFFLLPCSLFCLFPLRSCFCQQFDLCSLLICLLFLVTIALLDSHHLEYRYSPLFRARSSECRAL